MDLPYLQGEAEKLKKFLLVFALCHTVIPEVEEGMLHYHASSPDEEALVKAAKDLGVVFKARTPDAVIVEVVSSCYRSISCAVTDTVPVPHHVALLGWKGEEVRDSESSRVQQASGLGLY